MELNNLPTSLKKLVFDMGIHYDKDLNCLPDFMEELHLNKSYKKRIIHIPSNLKKLVCDKDYPYINDFSMCEIEFLYSD